MSKMSVKLERLFI